MNVLSLFDGMSCGMLALQRAGIRVDNYYASEVDKYAIKVSKSNYPGIKQLGDILNWREWDIDWESIDLLIGGSPCQGFSKAGKQLAFDDPRSILFFIYVDILEHIKKKNPKVKFVLENVRMIKEYLDVITDTIGVEPVCINSSLLSAQNRVRYYWSNLLFQGPEDKGILLRDIIHNKHEHVEYIEPNKNIHKLFNTNPSGKGMNGNVYGVNAKSPTLTTNKGEGIKILIVPEATKKGFVEVNENEGVDLTFLNSKTRRGRLMKYKSNCLTAANYDYYWFNGDIIRKLTPIECERLQTVPDNYTKTVSNSQRYKMLGNGWTIDVIAHIFKGLK